MSTYKRNTKYLICAAIVFLAVFLVVAVFMASKHWGKAYNDEIRVACPDGQHTLIIKEWGTIGGTGADIFLASDWGLITVRRQIGSTIADDCVYPFRDGYYQVSWVEESVIIRYYTGHKDENSSDMDSWRGYLEYLMY